MVLPGLENRHPGNREVKAVMPPIVCLYPELWTTSMVIVPS